MVNMFPKSDKSKISAKIPGKQIDLVLTQLCGEKFSTLDNPKKIK